MDVGLLEVIVLPNCAPNESAQHAEKENDKLHAAAVVLLLISLGRFVIGRNNHYFLMTFLV